MSSNNNKTKKDDILQHISITDYEKYIDKLQERGILKTKKDIKSVRNNHPYIPFKVMDSTQKGEKAPFLYCEYTRENVPRSEKFRSPWTNNYHDPKDVEEEEKDNNDNDKKPIMRTLSSMSSGSGGDGRNMSYVSKKKDSADQKVKVHVEAAKENVVRLLEISFNDVWDSYKNLYYGHDSVGSVFLKSDIDEDDYDTPLGNFEGIFGIQKKIDGGSSWNSVSYVQVEEPKDNNNECTYKITTTIYLILKPSDINNSNNDTTATNLDIGISVTKDINKILPVKPDKSIPISVLHIENIGTLIEGNEIDLRSNIEKVLIPKNYEMITTIQKEPIKSNRPTVNPIMGMVMNSDMLKKKLAKQQQAETEEESHSATTTTTTTKKFKPPVGGAGVNPLMAAAMNSDILKKKKEAATTTTTTDATDTSSSTVSKKSFKPPSGGVVNPLMAAAMNSDILKKKNNNNG